MRAASAKSNSKPRGPAGTQPADVPAPSALPAAASRPPFERWFAALKAVEPKVRAALWLPPSGLVTAIGFDGSPDESVLALAHKAMEAGRLQVAGLDGVGRSGLAAPLAATGTVCAVVLDGSVKDAAGFGPSFQVSLEKLAIAVAEAEGRPAAAAPSSPSGHFTADDALALLRAPGPDAFAEALYDAVVDALKPDSVALMRVKGSKIKVLRASTRFDPIPRGSRVGHARRVAILSAAESGRAVVTSWSDPGGARATSLDLGMLASGEGPAQAVAVVVPELSGNARLVCLTEFAERDETRFATILPELETGMGGLAETIDAIRGKGARKARSRADQFDWGKWLLRGAIGIVAVAAVIWLSLPTPLLVTGEATLTSTNQRSVVATRDGILSEVRVEPGQPIHAGDVLAEFDTRELRLRHNRIEAQLAQAQSRKQSATAAFKAAEIRVVDAEIEALEAERDLVDLLLEQSVVVATEDAIILSGDMAERVGSALRKGEAMFQLAPLEGYSVSIDVQQQDVINVRTGQTGTLKLTAMPFDEFAVEVSRVSPAAADASQSGVFNIRADLRATNPAFRPGMKGVVHIESGDTIRVWALTRDLVFWLRMLAWRWIP